MIIHRANADFWNDYRALPVDVRARAGKQFALLKTNPQHRPCNSRKSASGEARKFGRPA